ncbi:TPA: hypothetical protein RFL89_000596 [Klebsiella aerogenes]|nr:hypothetical protein [Klebsiella aerogenes]
MRKRISLEQAEHKTALVESLYETILEKAAVECSETLLNLISIACDFNQEIRQALIAALGKVESGK